MFYILRYIKDNEEINSKFKNSRIHSFIKRFETDSRK